MSDVPSRREELIAGALSNDLSDEEWQEFNQARAADRSIDAELAELRATATRLNTADITWQEEAPSPALEERIRTATSEAALGPDEVSRRRHRTRRRTAGRSLPALLTGAAALLIIGGLGGGLIINILDAPPTGSPGTLGIHEEIDFGEPPGDVTIDGTLVAHTWGTETLLEVDGLPVGETFEVVLVSHDGDESDSGTFFGAEETVSCAMNAAVLREDVSEVRIDDEEGTTVAASEVAHVDQ